MNHDSSAVFYKHSHHVLVGAEKKKKKIAQFKRDFYELGVRTTIKLQKDVKHLLTNTSVKIPQLSRKIDSPRLSVMFFPFPNSDSGSHNDCKKNKLKKKFKKGATTNTYLSTSKLLLTSIAVKYKYSLFE